MKILKEMPTGYGSKWQLIKINNDFFEFGTVSEINSFWGCSVDNVGTKTELINRLVSLKALSESFINDYTVKGYAENKRAEEFYYAMVCSFLDVLKGQI